LAVAASTLLALARAGVLAPTSSDLVAASVLVLGLAGIGVFAVSRGLVAQVVAATTAHAGGAHCSPHAGAARDPDPHRRFVLSVIRR
jgi:hypothetical protein